MKRQQTPLSAANEYHAKTKRPHQMWATDASYFRVVGWGYYYLVPATIYASGNVTGSFTTGNAPGDPSGDGVIDASDITCIERAVAADQDYPLNNGCDANEDGKVNALDITMIELMAT